MGTDQANYLFKEKKIKFFSSEDANRYDTLDHSGDENPEKDGTKIYRGGKSGPKAVYYIT